MTRFLTVSPSALRLVSSDRSLHVRTAQFDSGSRAVDDRRVRLAIFGRRAKDAGRTGASGTAATASAIAVKGAIGRAPNPSAQTCAESRSDRSVLDAHPD